MTAAERETVVAGRDLAIIAADILIAAGASPETAIEVGVALTDADAAGRVSHGTRLLPGYVERLQSGAVDGMAEPEITRDAGAFVRIDGRRAFGQVVGRAATRLGCERAKTHSVALVAISNATHFGRNARWPELAAAEGVASIHFGHGFGAAPVVAPHGGTGARLRTSPIAIGAPGPDGEAVILDFSVAELSLNSVKVLAERGERLPAGAAIGTDGSPTDEPAAVLSSTAALLPFGGFKGYGLAVFGEIFGGILAAGVDTGPGVNAMLSIYVDVATVGGADYAARLEKLAESLRDTPAAPGASPVAVPGDRSRAARRQAAQQGIPLTPALRQGLIAAADRAGVPQTVRAAWPAVVTSWRTDR